jgi:hypothetical protein
VLIKNLTVVNMVFLPLGVIASMGGMSEITMMLDDFGLGWRVGYAMFTIGMVIVGVALWRTIHSWISRFMDGQRVVSRPSAGPADDRRRNGHLVVAERWTGCQSGDRVSSGWSSTSDKEGIGRSNDNLSAPASART